MNNSIAFAKWFIQKHSNTGIIVNGNDLGFLLSQLDQSSWDEFSAFNSIKDTVDILIPILVPKTQTKRATAAEGGILDYSDAKPLKDIKKTRATKSKPLANTDNHPLVIVEQKEVKKRTPKAKISDTDVATEVEVSTEIVAKKKEVKKRAPKAKISDKSDAKVEVSTEIVAEVSTEIVAEVSTEIVAKKKEVKKRTPKAKISDKSDVQVEIAPEIVAEIAPEIVAEIAPEIVAEIAPEIVAEIAPEIVAEVSTEIVAKKKEVKKRTPKAKISDKSDVQVEIVAEVSTENVAEIITKKKEIKKRTPKATISSETEPQKRGGTKNTNIIADKLLKDTTTPDIPICHVIIPHDEHSKLTSFIPIENDELLEDLVFTECFVNDVLFYTDVDGNFFDSSFQLIDNPTI